MDYRERGSHARGVYLAQGNSKGETRGRKRHKNNARVAKESVRMERGYEGKNFIANILAAYGYIILYIKKPPCYSERHVYAILRVFFTLLTDTIIYCYNKN